MKAKKLTDEQREMFCRMFKRAFIEIRILGWQKNWKQAADLADCFHNLPLEVFSDDVRLDLVRRYLSKYHNAYGIKYGWDYINMLDEIENKSLEQQINLSSE